jgi:ADP-heptose:LPS heptosyltransferase
MAILGIHPGALGDVILFAQLLAALRQKLSRPVRLAAGAQKAALLAGLGAVDEALDYDALPMHEVFSERPVPQCRLPGLLRSCELLVSCLAGGDAAAEAKLKELTRARQAMFLPVRPEADWPGHLLDLWAVRAGLAKLPLPQWHAPAAWRQQAEAELARLGLAGRQHVLLHPGAGARDKCWGMRKFMELAAAMATPRLSPVFVIGPVELEWRPAEEIQRFARQWPVVRNPPLTTLAGLLGAARLFVGHDSGPAHLAAALGTPTLAIFGPSNPVHFAPRGVDVSVLHAPLERLEVQAVLAAVRQFFVARPSRP